MGKSVETETRLVATYSVKQKGLKELGNEDLGSIVLGVFFFFWNDENVLQLTVVTAEQLCDYTKATELYTLNG